MRELRNAIERAMMMEQDTILTIRYFDQEIHKNNQQSATVSNDYTASIPLAEKENKAFFILPPDGISIDEVEKELINQALGRFAGNQTQAAKCLHMTRDTFRYRLKKHGLSQKFNHQGNNQ